MKPRLPACITIAALTIIKNDAIALGGTFRVTIYQYLSGFSRVEIEQLLSRVCILPVLIV